jgi:hypothetical protein
MGEFSADMIVEARKRIKDFKSFTESKIKQVEEENRKLNEQIAYNKGLIDGLLSEIATIKDIESKISK